jgi:hypothetical protein
MMINAGVKEVWAEWDYQGSARSRLLFDAARVAHKTKNAGLLLYGEQKK